MTAVDPKVIAYSDIRLDGQRVLLLGGAGFIGHHLALALRERGAEVMVADNLQINNMVKLTTDPTLDPVRRRLYIGFALERFELMRGAGVLFETVDGRLMPELTGVFNRFQPTKAVHLAAISSAVIANQVPGLAYDIQINSLRALLELSQLRNSPCKHVLFMSSSTVYGDFEGDSVNETTRPQPRGVYANGKYIGERMVREAKNLYGLEYTIVRPSALYGIRCISGRVSQKFIENALTGKPLVLEGGGSGLLDFTHVDDLVEGLVRAMYFPGGLSRTFNVTFGRARTIADIAGIVKETVPQAVLKEGPPAPEKPKRGTLEINRAQEFLGFVPSRPIDTAYRDYCRWYAAQWERAQKIAA